MLFSSLRCYSHFNLNEMAATYQAAVHTLNTLQSNAAVLESIRATRDAQKHLSLPETLEAASRIGVKIQDIDKLSIIHVSGTKGKGSTCAFTDSILREQGFKTGFYSSPHLVEVRERIRINGRPLSREDFSRYFWDCYRLLEKTQDHHGGAMPAYFRFLTIMALRVFIEEQVDVAILEVGIGGAYDCTNIVRHPIVCGVASLGMDHTSILGDTIEKIAWHKAGIFKVGVPAFTVPQPDGAMAVLKERAAEVRCPLYVTPSLDQYALNYHKIDLGIPGNHQLSNASLAVQLANCWLENHSKPVDERSRKPFPVGIERAIAFEITPTIAAGLKNCKWPGRSQKIYGPDITYYLDGAHTDNSLQMCAEWFNAETAIEEATVKGPVARVLLFNSTGDRKPDILLSGLLSCKFDCAVFCPNIQRLSGKQNEDVIDMKVTLDSQLKRCTDNCNTWISLLKSRRHETSLNSVSSNHVLESVAISSSSVDNNCNNFQETCVMPTSLFNSIVESLFWISRGRESRLVNDISEPIVELPKCIRTAKRVFVLCTGSVHLVGDILSLLDPDVCDK